MYEKPNNTAKAYRKNNNYYYRLNYFFILVYLHIACLLKKNRVSTDMLC